MVKPRRDHGSSKPTVIVDHQTGLPWQDPVNRLDRSSTFAGNTVLGSSRCDTSICSSSGVGLVRVPSTERLTNRIILLAVIRVVTAATNRIYIRKQPVGSETSMAVVAGSLDARRRRLHAPPLSRLALVPCHLLPASDDVVQSPCFRHSLLLHHWDRRRRLHPRSISIGNTKRLALWQ